MNRIKKNDIVKVTSGKDKGKTGKVLAVFKEENRVLVEGVNMLKKHMRATRDNQQGGIVQIERPFSISNVMPYCKACEKPVRVGFSVSADKTKVRICKRCNQTI